MTLKELRKVTSGLYKIEWKNSAGGGTSLAAIGRCEDGSPWIAPTNWLSPLMPTVKAYRVYVRHIKTLTLIR